MSSFPHMSARLTSSTSVSVIICSLASNSLLQLHKLSRLRAETEVFTSWL